MYRFDGRPYRRLSQLRERFDSGNDAYQPDPLDPPAQENILVMLLSAAGRRRDRQ
jgi:hypothetical protein